MDLKAGNGGDEDVLRRIGESVKKIKYGSVEIIVHDSKIVQIECREKIRFDKSAAGKPEVRN